MDLQRLAEARSLAYHRVVADRLRADPGVLAAARTRAQRWLAQGHAPYYVKRWIEILAGPPEQIVDVLLDESEDAVALRSSSPFAGTLSPRERWDLWRLVRRQLESAP